MTSGWPGHPPSRRPGQPAVRAAGHARHLAAEQMVFCDECAGQGLNTVPSITDALLASPIWTFWWD